MHVPVTATTSAVATVLASTTALADVLHVPAEFPTIQAAIDAAAGGCEIVVAGGTYTGDGNRDLDFGGKAITLRCAKGAPCIIDIQAGDLDPHRAFYFHSGETAESVVEGFTVENGYMSRGGAVLCEGGSSPLFRSCIFRQNVASQAVAEDGGGAVYALASSPTFMDCLFDQNHTEANFLYGGGGAVHTHSGSTPTFIECTFHLNTASGPQESDGGAVAILDGSHPVFLSCTFTENQAYWDGAVTSSSSVTMHDCHFLGNVATDAAGGAYGAFGPLFGGGTGTTTLVNCSFVGNSAIGNVAQGGSAGAVLLQGQDVCATLTNCLFVGNESIIDNGGALWVGYGADATATNCTFAQNSASELGGGIWVSNSSSAIAVNCLLWDNLPQQISVSGDSSITVSSSNVQGGYGIGNIDADPLFVDPDAGDFRLSAGSPCIDAGDNTAVPDGITTDLDGNQRLQNDPATADTGDGDCPIVDMGGYEFATTCPWDLDCSGQVGIADLLALLAAWGTDPDGPPDFDGDGNVGISDLLELLANWGPCS